MYVTSITFLIKRLIKLEVYMSRFCVALEEMDNKDVPMALVLGCGTPLLVRQRAEYITLRPDPITVPDRESIRVSEVRSNVTSDGLLTVLISVLGIPKPKQYVLPRSQRVSIPDRHLHNCYVVVAVLTRGSLVAQKDTPCQDTLAVSMEGFVRGPYEVCATISKFKTDELPICVVPQILEPVGTLQMKSGLKNLNTALVGIALGLMFIVIGLVWFVRKMLKKPSEFQTHRCFRTEPVAEENPRASYVMLTATSKV